MPRIADGTDRPLPVLAVEDEPTTLHPMARLTKSIDFAEPEAIIPVERPTRWPSPLDAGGFSSYCSFGEIDGPRRRRGTDS